MKKLKISYMEGDKTLVLISEVRHVPDVEKKILHFIQVFAMYYYILYKSISNPYPNLESNLNLRKKSFKAHSNPLTKPIQNKTLEFQPTPMV